MLEASDKGNWPLAEFWLDFFPNEPGQIPREEWFAKKNQPKERERKPLKNRC